MFVPEPFKEDRLPVLHEAIRAAHLAALVTAGPDGLTASERAIYLETGEPMDKAGAYGIQGRASAFVKNITDEEYLEEVIPAPEFGGSFIHPGSESRFGVEATWRF